MNNELIKILISYWGAFLATTLATIKLIEFFRDKARIKVDASLIFRSIDDDEECKGTKVATLEEGYKEILLRISVVNSGRRSIQITSIIVETPGDTFQVIPDNFPVILQSLTSIETAIQKEWIDQDPISLLGVSDALGNKYRIDQTSLQKLLEETNSYPSNKRKYRRKDGTGEITTAFQVKDKSVLVKKAK